MIQKDVSIEPSRKQVVAGRELEALDLVGPQILSNLSFSTREPEKYASVSGQPASSSREANREVGVSQESLYVSFIRKHEVCSISGRDGRCFLP